MARSNFTSGKGSGPDREPLNEPGGVARGLDQPIDADSAPLVGLGQNSYDRAASQRPSPMLRPRKAGTNLHDGWLTMRLDNRSEDASDQGLTPQFALDQSPCKVL